MFTQEAYKWYFRAITEVQSIREPYVECDIMAYELSDWPTVFYMMEKALKITQKSSTYVNMGYAWDYTPDDLCAISCYWLGMSDRSLAHTRAALAYSPNNVRLMRNLEIIQKKLYNDKIW